MKLRHYCISKLYKTDPACFWHGAFLNAIIIKALIDFKKYKAPNSQFVAVLCYHHQLVAIINVSNIMIQVHTRQSYHIVTNIISVRLNSSYWNRIRKLKIESTKIHSNILCYIKVPHCMYQTHSNKVKLHAYIFQGASLATCPNDFSL